MRVIHDARDVKIDHFESSNRIRPPLISMLAQYDDCQFAVHFSNSQPPWHSLPLLVPEIWRFAQWAQETVGHL